MSYNKQDAVMTRGLAILCMLALHLFCRKGADVFGTPLLWLNETTPFVYQFGFFAGICVPLYSICAGYARQLNAENRRGDISRVFRLMRNYWIVLFLFCSIGLAVNPRGNIPGSFGNFVKSIFLLHSYNGAWWYLNTYIILMLIPTRILLFPVKKLDAGIGILFCICLDVIWYFVGRFSLLPNVPSAYPVLAFVRKEVVNLFGVLPSFWVGAFLCKCDAVKWCDDLLKAYPFKNRNMLLLLVVFLLFVGYNLLEKRILVLCVTIISFLAFNLIQKPEPAKRMFLFLGKHSTNIWLTHMFFYSQLFVGLTQKAKFPLLMLLSLLLYCVLASYVIKAIAAIPDAVRNKTRP